MEGYPIAAMERAMKVHEVILQARARKISWLEAADVLGIRPRTLRRWKWRMDRFGLPSLVDRRRRVPSPRRVPGTEVDRILSLYRERYAGFNVRHFHQVVKRDHGVAQSYSFVKQVLQGRGWCASTGRGASTACGGNGGRAWARCCTSTAAAITGWRSSRSSGRP